LFYDEFENKNNNNKINKIDSTKVRIDEIYPSIEMIQKAIEII